MKLSCTATRPEFEAAVHAFLQEAAAAGEPVLVALPGRHLAHVREALR